MEIRNEISLLIEREQGLALLDTWEKMGMVGMKCYGDTNAFLKVGNILRKLKNKNTKFVFIDVKDYFDFSINIITNPNLIEKKKVSK